MNQSKLISTSPYALIETKAGVAVFLKETGGEKAVVIFIDHASGDTLHHTIKDDIPVRPGTVYTLINLMSALEATLRSVIINEHSDSLFKARLTIDVANEVIRKIIELDVRPSDAMILAAKFRLPVKFLPSVWQELDDASRHLPLLDKPTTESRAVIFLPANNTRHL